VIVGFLWNTLVEVLVMPITYRVIAYMKKREPTYNCVLSRHLAVSTWTRSEILAIRRAEPVQRRIVEDADQGERLAAQSKLVKQR
jgi:hypothetical protein